MRAIGDHGFDIRHISVRHGQSEVGLSSPIGWIDVNIIFAVSDEFRIYADGASREWVPTVIYQGITDPDQITDWYESVSVKQWRTEKHPNRVTGLAMNDRSFLRYIPKFNVYQFHEIVENNQITAAALREFYQLHAETVNISSRFVPISRLMRSLECLSIFWD